MTVTNMLASASWFDEAPLRGDASVVVALGESQPWRALNEAAVNANALASVIEIDEGIRIVLPEVGRL